MFVLRRISSKGVERNTALGESYLLVNAERNPEDFKKSMDVLKADEEEIYGFIWYQEGEKQIPLYKKSIYFVMMSDGKTFANITLR